MAKRELARRGAAQSLGVTTLLHETYLDMAARHGASFPDRAQFMGYAARVMRGLIVVDLKFFCGFSLGEIAAMRGVSERTAQRSWEKARIFLHRAIRSHPPL